MSTPSYILSSPVSVTDSNPVVLNFNNTASVGSVIWTTATTATDQLNTGTNNVASTNVLTLLPDTVSDPAGAAQAPRLRLKRGVNSVILDTDSTLSESYAFNFPATGPAAIGQALISSGLTNIFYNIDATNVVTVRLNPAPNEFSSLAAAIASIPVNPAAGYPTTDNRYTIWVQNGDYTETQIVVPSWVFIVGQSMQNVRFFPAATGYTFMTFGEGTGLAFATIKNTDPAFPAVTFYNCGDYALFHKIEFEGCSMGIMCSTDSSATETSLCYLEYIGTTDCLVYSLYVQDTNTIGGFGSEVSIENFFTYGHNGDGVVVDGLNSLLLSQATVLQGDSTGNAIRVINGAQITPRGTFIQDWTNGIYNPTSTGVVSIFSEGLLFEGCGQNFNIIPTTTTGYNSGYTDYSLTTIPKIAPFFNAGQDQQIITVAQKGGDFSSVAAALAAITDNSAVYRYTIYVGPGIYQEPQLVLKPYVNVVGFFATQCILQASDGTQSFVIGAGYSSLYRITLGVVDYAHAPPYLIEWLGDPTGVHFRADDVIFDTSATCIHVGSTGGPSLSLFFDPLVNQDAPITTFIIVDDSGPNNYPVEILLDGLVWNPDANGLTNFTELMTVTSFLNPASTTNVFAVITDCSIGTATSQTGTAIVISGPVYAAIESTILGGFVTGLSVPNNAQFTYLLTTSCTFSNNTTDVNIANPNAMGTLNVNATIAKVTIANGAAIGVTINDPTGGIALTGTLYQGDTWQYITNISDQIQNASTVGVINTPNLITAVSGLIITVAAGTGYVFLGPITNNYLQYLTWATANLTLTDDTLNWIYISSTGVVSFASSEPNYIQNIILGTVQTYGSAITYIQQTARLVNNLASNVDQVLRTVFGPIVQSGCLASPGSSSSEIAVQVSSGSYWLSVTNYLPVSNDNVSMIGYYGGVNQTAAFTNIPIKYDDAGVLTAIPSGNFAKDALYILTSLTGSTQYFLVFGQQLFTSEADADVGPDPTPPSTFVGNMCPVAGIVISGDDPGNAPIPDSRFRDIRPTLSYHSQGTTASADHNSLLNLTVGNAHPQYFRVDGTEVMTGDVDLGTNNIYGAGGNLLNGVNLLAHETRHLPGGPDALATGTPVTIGTVNSPGSAASFPMSDHVHAHGAQTDPTLHAIATDSLNGFMSSTDKTKLDGSTSADTPSTLVQRDANGMIQISQLQFLSSNSAFYMAIQPSPTGFAGPNHTISIPVPTTSDTVALLATTQTFTNKTITGTTNTVGASQLQTTGADVIIDTSAPPTTSQSLVATGATAAAWSFVPNAGLQNSSITINTGSGLSGGGTVSLGGSLTLTASGTDPGVFTHITLTDPTNQIIMGTTNTVTIDSIAPSASRLYYLPDAGGTATFVLTNTNTFTIGDLLYANSTTSFANLLDVATGNALISGGVGVAPAWGKINLTTAVSMVLPIANGGTNSGTALAGGDLMVSSGGKIVEGTSSTTPTFVSANLTAVTSQLVLGTTTTTTISATAPGSSIVYTIPDTVAASTFVLTTTATNAVGDLIYASGTHAFTNLPDIAVNNVLLSGGVGVAPSYGKVNVALMVMGVLPIVNGGTNSSTALAGGDIMVSSGGKIVEGTSSTNPMFVTETLTAVSNQLVLGTTATTTISSSAPVASRTYTLADAGGAATFVLTTTTTNTTGDLIYASAANAFTNLPDIVVNNVLLSGGVGVAPSYGKVNVALMVMGVLPVVNGGTNSSTALANGDIMVSSGGKIVEGTSSTNPMFVTETLTAVSNQLVLGTTTTTTISSSAPVASRTYTLADAGGAATFVLTTTTTNTVGDLIYASAANAFTNLPDAATNNVLLSGGVGVAPSYGKVNVALMVTGTLPVVNGGTSSNTALTNGKLMVSSGGAIIEGTSSTTPSFTSETLTATANQLVLGTTNTITVSSTAPSTSRTYTLPDTNSATSTFVLTTATTFSTGDILTASGAGVFTNLPDVATGNVLLSGGVTTAPSYGKVNLTTTVSNTLPIANGGTNSNVALNGNRIIVSSATAIVEAAALTNGQLLIGSTGAAPVAASLTGTTNQVIVTPGAGTITLSLPQSIDPTSTPTFASETLTATTSQLTLGTTNTTTISSLAPTASRTYTIQDAGAAANIVVATSPYVVGDILYAGTTTNFSRLAAAASGNVLLSGTTPAWGKVNLTTAVSNTLPVANGGTNSNVALNGNRVMVSSATAIVEAAALVNGGLLIGSTGAAPVSTTLTAGSGISIANAAGSITISSNAATIPRAYSISTAQLSVANGAAVIGAYFAWQESALGSYTTRTVIAWVVPSATTGKNLTISVLPNGGASIGSVTINGGIATGAIFTFTFTDPGADTVLEFSLSRTGTAGANPLIEGINMELH